VDGEERERRTIDEDGERAKVYAAMPTSCSL
jgi:hypothetical protein